MKPSLGASLFLVCGHCLGVAQESALPQNYKVVLSDSLVRVIRVHYAPHEKVPVHTHPETPTIYVYLNDGPPVRFSHYEAKPFTLVRPATHKGAFRVSPGRLERHTAENLGDVESDFLRIELPGFRLGDKELDFRQEAPKDLSHNYSGTEFSAPGLNVSRTICVGAQACGVAEETKGTSVLVALSRLALLRSHEPAIKRTVLESGEVVKAGAGERLQVAPVDDDVAHLLEIRILAPGKP